MGGNVFQTMGANGVQGLTYFTIGSDSYVAFAEIGSTGTSRTSSHIYKWIPSLNCFGNGVACNNGTAGNNALQGIANITARSVDAFSVGADTYLLLNASSGYGGHTYLYKWIPSLNCFGNGVACANTATVGANAFQEVPLEGMYGGMISSIVYPVGSDLYISGYDLNTNNFFVYKYSNSIAYACTTYMHSATSGTTTLASSYENTGISTGPLYEDTTITLSCPGIGGVTVPIIVVPEPKPNLTITSVVSPAAEPSTNGSFRFTIDTVQTSDIVVTYTTSGSTATAGTDYTALSGSATILAGQLNSSPVQITPIDDFIFEGSETVRITAQASGNYVGTPSATLTITDNEMSTNLPSGAFDNCLTAVDTCELGVNPARVRKGGVVTISWNVSGLVTGANGNDGNVCSITSSPIISSAGFPPPFAISGSNTWIGSVSGVPINQQTIITLRCLAPDGTTSKSTSKTVQIIPTFQEL